MSSKPDINVLLVTADQMRADCLSAAGHPLVRTPAFDELAADGMLFARTFGQCTPCGPSRTSLLTGMYQMNHRSVQNGTPLDAGFTNLAEQARIAGFEPWLIGHTDTTMDPRRFHANDPRALRYEEILPGLLQFAPGSELGCGDEDWRFRLKELGYEGWSQPYAQVPDYPGAAQRGPSYAPIRIKAEHSDTAYTTDRAIRFVQHRQGKPWFLHLSYLKPHPPLVAPEPWHDMYNLNDVPDFEALPSLEDEKAFHPYMPFRLDRLEMNPKLPFDKPPNDNLAWRQARATYYGLISELDANFGRLMRALRDAGEYERTLIIFTSDHGEMLGDHWCWGKKVPFDKAVHVPLIIRSPFADSATRGRTEQRFTESIDLMPTILEHLGLEIPLQCDGRSLQPFIQGNTPTGWREDVMWETDFREIANDAAEREFGISLDECGVSILRTETAKYVHFGGLPPMFFDLEKDPAELRNLAGDPAAAAQMLDLAQRMLTRRMVFNRRELTGMCLSGGRQETAARERRIS